MGQVYGLHLLAGGAEVTYFVRERYVDELRAGTTLHALPRGGSRKLVPTHVRADMTGLAEGFDQVWLCVPTNALTSGALDTVLAAVARAERSSLVCMLPGMQVRALLDEHVPRARVVDGMIGMIAYEAPLPGEQLAPGTAYVLPRLSPSKYSGNEPARVRAVTQLLRAGGCPAGEVKDARVSLAFSSCAMMPMVVALEGAGWRFGSLRQGDWLTLAAGAAREALTLTGAELGVPVPWFRPLLARALRRRGVPRASLHQGGGADAAHDPWLSRRRGAARPAQHAHRRAEPAGVRWLSRATSSAWVASPCCAA